MPTSTIPPELRLALLWAGPDAVVARRHDGALEIDRRHRVTLDAVVYTQDQLIDDGIQDLLEWQPPA
ncbi:hypothetical protein ACQEU5_24420 [Marinactinospora thermotolerans]|uniref:Uncharacterized protein n=1 Tax=Marinactinospora thermotolerans DSM 45154 TaxID=1122192 RepID=A0A1T4KFG7_9ACTN|nr:hypothetical protein [Marinactinospora thermotolerans]SJZ41164.1 hypothetical protein SAMN02745673_00350 [Marinactinospora thermotolerans DSM 45154]